MTGIKHLYGWTETSKDAFQNEAQLRKMYIHALKA